MKGQFKLPGMKKVTPLALAEHWAWVGGLVGDKKSEDKTGNVRELFAV